MPLAVANQVNQLPAPALWIRRMQRNRLQAVVILPLKIPVFFG